MVLGNGWRIRNETCTDLFGPSWSKIHESRIKDRSYSDWDGNIGFSSTLKRCFLRGPLTWWRKRGTPLFAVVMLTADRARFASLKGASTNILVVPIAHTFECEWVRAAGKRMQFKDVKSRVGPYNTWNYTEQWQIQRRWACGNLPHTAGPLPSINIKTYVFLSHYVFV